MSQSAPRQTVPRWGMAVDTERCIGCHACSVACKVENAVYLGMFRTKVYYHDFHGRDAVGKNTLKRAFLPTLCMHCEDAPCLKACPTEAIRRDADGVVRIDADTCDRSRDCIAACPYGAIHIDPVAQVADKCDLCSHRLDAGLQPACVEACPTEVFAFGDLGDPDSPISRFNAKYARELTVLKPEEGARPMVQYRGIGKVVPRAVERKLPKGRNHDPFTYEIDTWAELRADYGTEVGEAKGGA
ncbi:4Fe-4S dicluster domain-containing protein [Massilia phyllosphaerae]|uniref:4Fe-4S dicluster domain-containing protein n=1 Tax=Massilia phyllosphaerae TaxID=3106034 RepID=UPI002B1CC02C|nr:4Fe-4S dicluster domain-containing protein [Massilia sp. SGZ-792]